MLTIENLNNIHVFLLRVGMTGQEALGWVQTMEAVEAELRLMAPVVPPAEPAKAN